MDERDGRGARVGEPSDLGRDEDRVKMRRGFAGLLQAARLRLGISQSQLARQVGIDASYLNRIEREEREPPRREVVEALAAALGLSSLEADELLVVAGQLPRALASLGPLDPSIRLVAEALADHRVPSEDRQALRQTLALVVPRFACAQSKHDHP